jgi:iron-sulfur cluster assembly accessory protein
MGVLPRVLLIGLVACSCRDKNVLDPKPTTANQTATSMTTPTSEAPHAQAPIRFTHLAATKINEIRAAEKIADDLALRVEVRTVPSAPGFEYNLYFDDRRKPGDQELDANGIKVVLDPSSLASVAGTEVDFIEGSEGAGFKFKNPNVSGRDDGVPDGPPTYGVLER